MSHLKFLLFTIALVLTTIVLIMALITDLNASDVFYNQQYNRGNCDHIWIARED